jgi:FkbM family methyltransferase
MQFGQVARVAKHLHRLPEVAVARRHSAEWRELTSRYVGLGDATYPYELRMRDGVRLTFESREEVKVFWNVYVRLCYQVDPDDRVIFDVGANIGVFTAWAGSVAPNARIFSFEPWPPSYARLVRHVEANGLGDRVTALNVALGGEAGTRHMGGSDVDSPNRRIDLHAAGAGAAPAETGVAVECRTLADVLDELGVAELDLLKMDIEGGEYETLLTTPTSVLRRIKSINLEYHEVPADLGYTKEALFDHLSDAGHTATHVSEDQYRTGVALFRRA